MNTAAQPPSKRNFTVFHELKRKSLHVALAAVPALYFVLPQPWAILGLILATFAVVILDVIRLRSDRLNAYFYKHFGRIIRGRERTQFVGATYYVIGAAICVLVFDERIAIAALAFLVVGDTAAALIGRRYGKARFWEKSIEGSLACFLTCVALGIAIVGSWPVAIAGALMATVAEAVPLPVDDNLRVPLLSGTVMQVVTFLS